MKILSIDQTNWNTLEENRDIWPLAMIQVIELCESGELVCDDNIDTLIYNGITYFRYSEKLQIIEVLDDLWDLLTEIKFGVFDELHDNQIQHLDRMLFIILRKCFNWTEAEYIHLFWID